MKVSPCEPLENVLRDIIKRTAVEEPVQPLIHRQKFIEGKHCGFYESKTIQLKNIKAERTKKTTLANRMTGETNKFSLYVSAFANYKGGHIYFGINDDGVIERERISSSSERASVTRKVENTIKKLIWPDQTVPIRGKHWEIYFEPVLDENSKSIPTTFVIVVYIAHCFGGVFTKEPECYEMVKNEVQKMSFTSWKKAILQPIRLPLIEIPQSVQRTRWSSTKIQKLFTEESEKLRILISNGDWDLFFEKCKVLQTKSKTHVEVFMLLVLLQEGRAHCRRGELTDACVSLEKYKKILPKILSFFEVMGLYMEAALARASGSFDMMKNILEDALFKAELIQPGVVTATVYVFAGTDLTNVATNSSSHVLNDALEHLKHVPDQYHVRADMQRRAYMNLAMFYLGYNINDQCMITKSDTDTSRLKKAEKWLRAIDDSLREGHPSTKYHDAQYNLVLSVYKCQKGKPDAEGITYLYNAYENAQKAERLAKEGKFVEIEKLSRDHQTTVEIRMHEQKKRIPRKAATSIRKGEKNKEQNNSSPKKGKSIQDTKLPPLCPNPVRTSKQDWNTKR